MGKDEYMKTEQKALQTGFDTNTTADEVIKGINLAGKNVVITGGHAGLGLETTRVLVGVGAHVIVGARDVKKAREAVSALKGVAVMELDLASPASIDSFAKAFLQKNLPLHILINNAGIMATPLSKDERGFESQFATNHLGHFQLTAKLWPALKSAHGSRVISLSSLGHRFGGVDLNDPNYKNRPYEKWAAYGQSKSANSLFAVELDKVGQPYGIRAFAVHPGRIAGTELVRHMSPEELKAAGIYEENGVKKVAASGGISKTIPQGAATTVWAATAPKLEGKGGGYCENGDIAEPVADDSKLQGGIRRWAIDSVVAKQLWELSEKLTEIKWPQ